MLGHNPKFRRSKTHIENVIKGQVMFDEEGPEVDIRWQTSFQISQLQLLINRISNCCLLICSLQCLVVVFVPYLYDLMIAISIHYRLNELPSIMHAN